MNANTIMWIILEWILIFEVASLRVKIKFSPNWTLYKSFKKSSRKMIPNLEKLQYKLWPIQWLGIVLSI
jgi:hypothetical protein